MWTKVARGVLARTRLRKGIFAVVCAGHKFRIGRSILAGRLYFAVVRSLSPLASSSLPFASSSPPLSRSLLAASLHSLGHGRRLVPVLRLDKQMRTHQAQHQHDIHEPALVVLEQIHVTERHSEVQHASASVGVAAEG